MLIGGSWVIGKQEGDCRVLTEMPRVFSGKYKQGDNIGVAIDFETTGLDPEVDEILSLGFIKFGFNDEMEITHVIESDQFYNEPTIEIPELITTLTGIDIETVRGKKITKETFDYVFNGTEIAIAHNAKFDRQFADRNYRSDIIWGCTNADLNLREKYNVPSGSLGVLMAYLKDYYFGHHDALEDCWALLHLLAIDDHFAQVVTKCYTESWDIYARNSPFESKDALKKRGYKWSGDMKMWFYPGADYDKKVEETEWLLEELRVTAEPSMISRFDRHKTKG